jgi:hypothetical protein
MGWFFVSISGNFLLVIASIHCLRVLRGTRLVIASSFKYTVRTSQKTLMDMLVTSSTIVNTRQRKSGRHCVLVAKLLSSPTLSGSFSLEFLFEN